MCCNAVLIRMIRLANRRPVFVQDGRLVYVEGDKGRVEGEWYHPVFSRLEPIYEQIELWQDRMLANIQAACVSATHAVFKFFLWAVTSVCRGFRWALYFLIHCFLTVLMVPIVAVETCRIAYEWLKVFFSMDVEERIRMGLHIGVSLGKKVAAFMDWWTLAVKDFVLYVFLMVILAILTSIKWVLAVIVFIVTLVFSTAWKCIRLMRWLVRVVFWLVLKLLGLIATPLIEWSPTTALLVMGGIQRLRQAIAWTAALLTRMGGKLLPKQRQWENCDEELLAQLKQESISKKPKPKKAPKAKQQQRQRQQRSVSKAGAVATATTASSTTSAATGSPPKAASSASMAAAAAGGSATAASKPKTPATVPATAAGGSATAAGKPKTPATVPATAGQGSATADAKASTTRAATAAGKPASAVGKPATATSKPATAASQPAAASVKPATASSSPVGIGTKLHPDSPAEVPPVAFESKAQADSQVPAVVPVQAEPGLALKPASNTLTEAAVNSPDKAAGDSPSKALPTIHASKADKLEGHSPKTPTSPTRSPPAPKSHDAPQEGPQVQGQLPHSSPQTPPAASQSPPGQEPSQADGTGCLQAVLIAYVAVSSHHSRPNH